MSQYRARQIAALPTSQRGVVLFIALIALVVMSMVGISMVRQMTSGQQIVGNLAFKLQATSFADSQTEQVLVDLTNAGKTPGLLDGAAFPGYHPEAPEFKAQAFDAEDESTWEGKVRLKDTPVNGVHTTYVVHRLCYPKGADEARRCVGHETSGGREQDSDPKDLPKQIQPYYRVTTLVEGDRNSRSITQTMIY
ncbi:MAG: hypothetical protein L6Q40_10425 [Azonexus sp.]|nr:hypothetical protein [Azonexus sp.]